MRRPVVRDRPRIYVDSNVYLYSTVADAVFGESCASVLTDIRDGRLDAHSSVLVVCEAANAIRRLGRPREVGAMAASISSLPMTFTDLTPSLAVRGAELAIDARGDPYDGAHAATMHHLGIRTIITADSDFDRFQNVSRLDPREYEARTRARP